MAKHRESRCSPGKKLTHRSKAPRPERSHTIETLDTDCREGTHIFVYDIEMVTVFVYTLREQEREGERKQSKK